ncbi:MAG: HAD family phosphatase [Chloroflexi bacterium]|nr:HAD family phosphatase [Chloroflexota bacterium]
MRKQLRAAIFDMDGLMVDTERVARMGWKHAFRQFGIDLTDEEYLHFLGISTADVSAMFAERFGERVEFEDVYAVRQQHTNQFYEENGVPLKPGIVELLSFLKSAGVERVVATSSTEEMARFRLQKAGLLEWFSFISSSDRVGRGKPAPDVYLAAIDWCGLETDECVALEDSEAGVRAAHAAGLRVIWVPDLAAPSEEAAGLAVRVAADLYDARQWIESRMTPDQRIGEMDPQVS